MGHQLPILIERIDSTFPEWPLLTDFTKKAELESRVMSWTRWPYNADSFLFRLYKYKMYDEENKGSYYVGLYNDEIVCGGGLARLHDTNYAHVFTRMYTLPEFRGKTQPWHQALTKNMVKDVKRFGYDGYVISFNDENRRYHKMNFRSNDPSKIKYVDGDPYIKDRFVIPFFHKEEPVLINKVKQWINYYPDNIEMKNYLESIHADKQ